MAVSTAKKIEILRRIELTGEFMLLTHCSYREISEIFSNNSDKYFTCSHVTIKDYIEKYKLKHKEHEEEINKILIENKKSSIKDETTINRIYKVFDLLSQGYNFEKIAKLMNESYWVVYYDIHLRLKKLDNNLYNKALNMIVLNAKLSKQDK